MEFKHYSVLRDETIENLNIRPDGIYVDGTLGGAGHSYEIAKRLSDKGRLIGIDQDADAIKAAGERLAEFGDRVTIVRSNYSDMKNVLHSLGIEKPHCVSQAFFALVPFTSISLSLQQLSALYAHFSTLQSSLVILLPPLLMHRLVCPD